MKRFFLIAMFLTSILSANTVTDTLASAAATVYIDNGNDINETRSDWTATELSDNIEYIKTITLTEALSLEDADMPDFPDLTGLEEVDIENNNFTTLDFSSNSNLTKINVSGNTLTSLYLPDNIIEVVAQDNSLTSVDLSNKTAITKLDLKWNPIEDLSFLLDAEQTLEYIDVYNYDIGYYSDIVDFTIFDNHFPNLTFIDLVNSYNLVKYDDDGNLIDKRANEDSTFCKYVFDAYPPKSNYNFPMVQNCKVNLPLYIASLYDYTDDPDYDYTAQWTVRVWVDLNDDGIKDEGEIHVDKDYWYYRDNKDKIKQLEINKQMDAYQRGGGDMFRFFGDLPSEMRYEFIMNGVNELTALETLSITGHNGDTSTTISDAYPMPVIDLPNLKNLSYTGAPQLSFLDTVAPQLETLELNLGMKDSIYLDDDSLASLKKATNLKVFSLHTASPLLIEGIGDLSFAPDLKVFRIGHIPAIDNLDILNGVNLEVFEYISYNYYFAMQDHVVDISNLSTQTNLKFLKMSGWSDTAITDLTPIENLEHIGENYVDTYNNLNMWGAYQYSGRTQTKINRIDPSLISTYDVNDEAKDYREVASGNSNVALFDLPYRAAVRPGFNTPFCAAIGNPTDYCKQENMFLAKLVEIKDSGNPSDYDRQVRIWIDLNEDNVLDDGELYTDFSYQDLADNKDKIKKIEMGVEFNHSDFKRFDYQNDDSTAGINELTNLEELRLFFLNSPKADDFEGMTNLKRVYFYTYNGFEDLSFLNNLTGLEELKLSNIEYTDSTTTESAFEYNTEHEENSNYDSYASRSGATDFSSINNLSNIKVLLLSGFYNLNQNLDQIDFSQLSNLEELSLRSGTTNSDIRTTSYDINTLLGQLENLNIKNLQLDGLYLIGDTADFSGVQDTLEILSLRESASIKITGFNSGSPLKRMDLTTSTIRDITDLSDLPLGGDISNLRLSFRYGDDYYVMLDNVEYDGKAFFDSKFCLISNINNDSDYCSLDNRFLTKVANSGVPVWIDLDDNGVVDTDEYKVYTLNDLDNNKTLIKAVASLTGDLDSTGAFKETAGTTYGFGINTLDDLSGIEDLTALETLSFSLLTTNSLRDETLDFSKLPSSLKRIKFDTYLTNLDLINGDSVSNLEEVLIYKPNILVDDSVVNFSNFANSNIQKISTIGIIDDQSDCGTNLSLGDINVNNLNLDNLPNVKYLNWKYLKDISGNKGNVRVLKTMITSEADALALSGFTGVESLTAFIVDDYNVLDDSIATMTSLKELNLGAQMLGSVDDISSLASVSTLSDLETIINFNGTITGGLCLTDTVLNSIPYDKRLAYDTEFCMSPYINQDPLLCSFEDSEFKETEPGLYSIGEINSRVKKEHPDYGDSDFISVWLDYNMDGIRDTDETLIPFSNNDLITIANNKEFVKDIDMPETLATDAQLVSMLGQDEINDFASYENLESLSMVVRSEGGSIDLSSYYESNLGELSITYTEDVTDIVNFSYLTKLKKIDFQYGELSDGYKPQVTKTPIVSNLPLLEEFSYRNGNTNYALNPNLSTNRSLKVVDLEFGSQEYDVNTVLQGLDSLRKVSLIFNGSDKIVNLGVLGTNQNISYIKLVENNPKCYIPGSMTSIATCDGVVYTEPFIETQGSLVSQDTLETMYTHGIVDYSGFYGVTGVGHNFDLEYHEEYTEAREGILEDGDFTSSNYVKPLPSTSPFCQSDAMLSFKDVNNEGYNAICSPAYDYVITSSDLPVSERDDGSYRVIADEGTTNQICISSDSNLEDYYGVAGSTDLVTDLAPYIYVDNSDGSENVSIDDMTLSDDKTELCLSLTKTNSGSEKVLIKFTQDNVVNPKFLEFSSTSVIDGVYSDLAGTHDSITNAKQLSDNELFTVKLFEDEAQTKPIDAYGYALEDLINIMTDGDNPDCVEPVMDGSHVKIIGYNEVQLKVVCGTPTEVSINIDNRDPNDNTGNPYTTTFWTKGIDSLPVIVGPSSVTLGSINTISEAYSISDTNFVLDDTLFSYMLDPGVFATHTIDTALPNEFNLNFSLTADSSRDVLLKIAIPSMPGQYMIKKITVNPNPNEGGAVLVVDPESSFLLVSTVDHDKQRLIKQLKKDNVKVYDMDSIEETFKVLKDKYSDTLNTTVSNADFFKSLKTIDADQEVEDLEIQTIIDSNNFTDLSTNDSDD